MPEKYFLILVTFRDLTLILTRLQYDTYAHMVSSLALWGYLLWLTVEQKLSTLQALDFIIQKRQNLIFDITLNRYLRSILKS